MSYIHPTTSCTDSPARAAKHTAACTISFPNVTTSLSCSIDPGEGDPFEFQPGWMRQFFSCCATTVLAGPGRTHAIVNPVTTTDGHKMQESPNKTSTDYNLNTWARCVFVTLYESGRNICLSFTESAQL